MTTNRRRTPLLFLLTGVLGCLLSVANAFVPHPQSRNVHPTALQVPTALQAVQVDPRTRSQTESRQRTTTSRTEDTKKVHIKKDASPPPPSRLEEFLERSRLPTRTSLNSLRQDISEQIEIRCEKSEKNDDAPETSSSKREKSSDESQPEAHGETTSDDTDGEAQQQQDRRKLAARAALLGSRVRGGQKPVSKASSVRKSSKSTTSVGDRRTGSASKARQGPGVTERIMDAVRKSAKPASSLSKNTSSGKEDNTNDNYQTKKDDPSSSPPKASFNALSAKHKLSASRIHAAMLEIMERQMKEHRGLGGTTTATAPAAGTFGWEQRKSPEAPFPRTPPPGTVLLPSNSTTMFPTSTSSSNGNTNNAINGKLQFPDCLTVRTATPRCDTEVAHLRLSVFSDFSPEVRRQLVSRSVKAVVSRRMQGATCLIATVPPSLAARKRNRPPVILGSAECSFHEFQGTLLGYQRPPQSILYITEVAVSPNARRRGVGAKLLQVRNCYSCVSYGFECRSCGCGWRGAETCATTVFEIALLTVHSIFLRQSTEILANMRGVETLYLHVDVDNKGALSLYEKAGYQMVDSSEPMFLEFTTKLNLHDGATKGRNHFLLYKDLVKRPTWLPPPPSPETCDLELQPSTHGPAELPRPATGTLGFEVSATAS